MYDYVHARVYKERTRLCKLAKALPTGLCSIGVLCSFWVTSRAMAFIPDLLSDEDCFYYHSWRNNVVIAFGTLSSFLT